VGEIDPIGGVHPPKAAIEGRRAERIASDPEAEDCRPARAMRRYDSRAPRGAPAAVPLRHRSAFRLVQSSQRVVPVAQAAVSVSRTLRTDAPLMASRAPVLRMPMIDRVVDVELGYLKYGLDLVGSQVARMPGRSTRPQLPR